ncbi:hypothetical protein E4U03_09540 [Rothia nasimurium]|uniref:Bro-N domain-containing protein n=1 Tax=Rothia nasimurium TaxID=85336 RepID=A0A4Y9F1R4_9MICC|nr:phage antirepressor [Rothia nasimurium]MBF0808842.1 phage antirepressor KilAC domain-containing protein [Rothia nasimurium]TFU21288.1 hypothetical protein E4U03_09540 [Rothia nasimurium]
MEILPNINAHGGVQAFDFNGLTLRALLLDGEPWFVLADLVKALGLTNASVVANRLREKGVSKTYTPTAGGRQLTTIIDEGNLYRVIMRSNSPAAEPFESWVTDDVLPAIRKTGSYTVEKQPETALEWAEKFIETEKARLALVEENKVLAPKAQAYDEFLGATGLISVKYASTLLGEAGINIGRNNLFTKLGELGWIYREGGAWVPNETRKKQGLITAVAKTRPDYSSLIPGMRKVANPKIHLTPKGLHKLRELLLPPFALEGVA